MAVAGFTYAGNVDVTTASGPALAMRFTMASARVEAYSTFAPCTAHLQWNSSTSSTASSPNGLTFDALEFRGVVGGVAVDWTAVATGTTTVPPPDPIPGGTGTIGGPVVATLAQLRAPVLTVPGMTGSLRSC